MIPVRYHHLKAAASLPARARALMAGEEADPSTALQRGTALHAIVFDTKKVYGWPEGKNRSGALYDAFVAANPDTEVLTAKEYEKVSRMAEAVRSDSEAMELLTGIHETTILWDQLGRKCRATPDCRSDVFVTELKSCADASPERFMRAAMKFGYPGQLAWQIDGCRAAGVCSPEEAFIVAVESIFPHPVTVLRLTPELLDMGRRTTALWFEKLLGCERSDFWPNRYVQSVVDFDVPAQEFAFLPDESEAAETA